MAYVYKIINNINGKIYIGKTRTTLEKRFSEHLKARLRIQLQDRPLYRAMNKYGVENFSIHLLEETDTPEEREVYWIEALQSFHYGYNATRGGDGRPYADYELIYRLWQSGLTAEKIKELTGHDRSTTKHALDTFNISQVDREQQRVSHLYKPVAQIDPITNEIIHVFASITLAQNECDPGRHIGAVCSGKRKTAGGFKWKFI